MGKRKRDLLAVSIVGFREQFLRFGEESQRCGGAGRLELACLQTEPPDKSAESSDLHSSAALSAAAAPISRAAGKHQPAKGRKRQDEQDKASSSSHRLLQATQLKTQLSNASRSAQKPNLQVPTQRCTFPSTFFAGVHFTVCALSQNKRRQANADFS